MIWIKVDRPLVITIQVHDELVLEVDPSVVKEAALLLQMCMESAAFLLGMCSILAVWLDVMCSILVLYLDILIISIYHNCTILFFSSFASQTASWKNMGFFGAFPGQSICKWCSCAQFLTKCDEKIWWHWRRRLVAIRNKVCKMWVTNQTFYNILSCNPNDVTSDLLS